MRRFIIFLVLIISIGSQTACANKDFDVQKPVEDTVVSKASDDFDTQPLFEDTGLEYQLNDNKNYYIVTGIGSFKGEYLEIPAEYKGLPIRAIADRAFDGCSNLRTIHCPKNIVTIGNAVFDGCTALTDLALPGVTTMGVGVFNGCASITDVVITADFISHIKDFDLENIVITKGNRSTITQSAFAENDTLFSVVISEGIESIDEDAFYKCEGLINVTLPDTLLSIGQRAFWGCKWMGYIEIPDSVTKIGIAAFRDCQSLIEIVIPGSVECITSSCFAGCTNLQNVTIENGVRNIGGYSSIGGCSFKGCNISNITIPESVDYIGKSIFSGNPLKSVTFENPMGWKAGSDNMLINDLYFEESQMSDPSFAAELLLSIGGRYNSLYR